MPDRYHALFLALLPLIGCPASSDSGDSGAADSGDSGDTGDTGDTADTGLPPIDTEQGCLAVDPSTTECPAAGDVDVDSVTPETCGAVVLSVDGAGTLDGCAWIGGFAPGTWCIYPITVQPPRPEDECDYGRPLILGGVPALAALVAGPGWANATRGEGLDPERAGRWARVALAEHASVASFARVVLELLALGAPADLVAETQAAGADEVRHARLAFALASRFAGGPLRPGPLALPGLTLAADLAEFAAATAREGCVAETLSSLLVGEARDRAVDPGEKATLAVLARDEERHAALAWRTVRWAVDVGGEPVREAVAAALATAPPVPAEGGLLPVEVAGEVVRRAWTEVIAPARDALLGGGGAAAHA